MKECKLCRTVMDDEADECPSCGHDPDTGATLESIRHGFRERVALHAEDRHWSQRGVVVALAD